MGSSVPANGYTSNATRTTLEVKNAIEAAFDVLRRMPGSSTALMPVTISAGGIAPDSGWLYVSPEGGTTDDLDTIDPTDYAIGSLIVLEAEVGTTITVNHNAGGTGEILLSGTSTFEMAGASRIWLRLDSATQWQEVDRTYGTNVAAFRAYLGLGDAALEDVGSGNGLDADTLDGQHAAAFLGVAATAADATLLGGVAASDYARKSVAALQSFAHNLQTGQGRFIANHSLGNSSGIEMHIGGAMLARLVAEDASPDAIRLELFASPGSGTVAAGIRLDTTGDIQMWDGSAWHEVYNQSEGVKVTDLDGTILTVDPESIFSTGGTSEHVESIGSLTAGAVSYFDVPSSMCWTPRVSVISPVLENIIKVEVFNGPTSGWAETRFKVTNTHVAVATTIEIRVRYIIGDPPVNV